MKFLLEIKESYTVEDAVWFLTQQGIKFTINNGCIMADLTFDEVASLKDMAYCIHQCEK